MSTEGGVEYLTCLGKARVGQHLVRGTSLGGNIWGGSSPRRPAGRFQSLPEKGAEWLTVDQSGSPNGHSPVRRHRRRLVSPAVSLVSSHAASPPPRRRLAAATPPRRHAATPLPRPRATATAACRPS